MPHIYKIVSPKNKIYVGSSTNVLERFKAYKRLHCKTQVRLYNSFKKYGVDNHIFSIICECRIEDIYKYENYYGVLYNVLDKNFGLNCVLPKFGDGFISRTIETRQKISKAQIGKIVSEETKNKLRIANIGKTSKIKGKKIHTDTSRKKMSISHSGKILSELTKKKISDSHKNKIPKNIELLRELKRKQVYIKDYNIIFNSIIDTANFFKVSASLISIMLSGKIINKYNIFFI